MAYENSWEDLTRWIAEPREFSLARGKPFKAVYNSKEGALNIVPTETGIVRTVSSREWETFIQKMNEVISNGYDPWRPGHYSKVTYNSSYLVAILKGFEDQKRI